MIILPVGHDKEIYHFPYVTAGIVVVCLAVQIYASFTTEDDADRARRLMKEQALREAIWRRHGRRFLEERHPELIPCGQEGADPQTCRRPRSAREVVAMVKAVREARQEFWEAFEDGAVVPTDDPDHRALREATKEREEGGGVLAHGYRWGGRVYTLVTYAFIHAGWFHLIGNMIFLYICGCNIEDRWGRVVWGLLYVGGGAAAALTWGAMHRGSPVPLVGASGAIAAAMGAFLVLAAGANLRFFYFFWLITYPVRGTFHLKAYWAFPLWLIQQLLGVYVEGISFTPVAYSAHVGGFAFGVLFALIMKWIGADARLQRASEDRAVLFAEHPLYLEGLSHLQNDNLVAAEAAFERLLAEKPDHVDASMELYRIKQDPAEAVQAASRAAVLARRSNDFQTPLTIYTDMLQRHPGAPLDARGLYAVAECYERDNDARAAVAVYERLIELHPQSPVAPRAMLNLAQIYKDRLDEPERARRALIGVMQSHADSPFADRAREILSQLGQGPSLSR